jgi:hypothetical protein
MINALPISLVYTYTLSALAANPCKSPEIGLKPAPCQSFLPGLCRQKEEHRTPEPQPKAETTGILKTGKCTDSPFPVFNIPVLLSSCGAALDFTAAGSNFDYRTAEGSNLLLLPS